jgi:hypothetical protein
VTDGLVTPDELRSLEATVQGALETGDLGALHVIGFGEVSTVLRMDTPRGPLACKRLLPYPDQGSADRAARSIRTYITELERLGCEVLSSEVASVPSAEATVAVYCVQPALPPESLAVEVFRHLDEPGRAAAFRRILEMLRRTVTPDIAPDGQLSNWAFDGDRMLYLDVSSPFMRDASGQYAFDFRHMLSVLPFPFADLSARFALDSTLAAYHSLRGQVIDLLGNLIKEQLAESVDPLLPVANETLKLDRPIERRHVDAYYASNARMYAAMQWGCRAKCWFSHNVLRRPLPYIPKPSIRRT